LNNVIHHLDDLKVANHKVEKVEKLIEEQDWKLRHSNMDYHLSFLSYVGMVITTLTCFIVLLLLLQTLPYALSKFFKVVEGQ
jgi:hypothetical protein